MWRRSLFSLLLLLALSSPLFSAERPDPETMTDSEIYAELSAISEKQKEDWKNLETMLPKLQNQSAASATNLEKLSASLTEEQIRLREQTNSLENSVEELEKKATTAEIWNWVLLAITGISAGVAAYAAFR